MQVIPEIYILDGSCVALYKGNIDQKEVYSGSPLDYALEFKNAGAKSILIIDLDKSEYGKDANLEIIKDLRANLDIELILAGGLREIDELHQSFEIGMDKVILGVSAQPIYKQAVQTFGAEKVFAGIKAKGDEVITDVARKFPLTVIELAEKLPETGITTVLYKDVWKESTQIGPNFDEVDRMLRMTPLKVYVGGGIGKSKHLEILKRIGTSGALVGKAIYERELDLNEIIYEFEQKA